jgi:thioredoxin 1
LNKSRKVAADFSATWCSPCRVISPVFNNLSDEYKDIEFISVDVDNLGSVASKYAIRAMPTFIFFRNGGKSDEPLGADKPALQARVRALNS